MSHPDWGKFGPPAQEWTDEEWSAVIKTIPWDAHFSVGEMAVAEMRGRDALESEGREETHP